MRYSRSRFTTNVREPLDETSEIVRNTACVICRYTVEAKFTTHQALFSTVTTVPAFLACWNSSITYKLPIRLCDHYTLPTSQSTSTKGAGNCPLNSRGVNQYVVVNRLSAQRRTGCDRARKVDIQLEYQFPYLR